MYQGFSAALLAVTFALPAFPHTGSGETVLKGPAVLHPINVRHYEAATGLRRREDQDFSDLDPNTQSQLIYGRPGGKPWFTPPTGSESKLTTGTQMTVNFSLRT